MIEFEAVNEQEALAGLFKFLIFNLKEHDIAVNKKEEFYSLNATDMQLIALDADCKVFEFRCKVFNDD